MILAAFCLSSLVTLLMLIGDLLSFFGSLCSTCGVLDYKLMLRLVSRSCESELDSLISSYSPALPGPSYMMSIRCGTMFLGPIAILGLD